MFMRLLLARASCLPWLRASYRAMLRVPGLGSVSRAAIRYALPFGTKVWAGIHSGEGRGLWLKVDPRWHKAYLEGSYEPGIQKLLREHLRPDDRAGSRPRRQVTYERERRIRQRPGCGRSSCIRMTAKTCGYERATGRFGCEPCRTQGTSTLLRRRPCHRCSGARCF